MRLLGASLLVPGVAAYCDQNVEKNPSLLQAALQWNKRNNGIMDRTVKALQRTGGISSKEKALADSLAFAMTKEFVNSEGNPEQLCRGAISNIENGSLDLDRRSDLSEAYRIISALSK
jgi:hypothetical protein